MLLASRSRFLMGCSVVSSPRGNNSSNGTPSLTSGTPTAGNHQHHPSPRIRRVMKSFPRVSPSRFRCSSVAGDEMSTLPLWGNFATLGAAVALPSLCIPAEERDSVAKGLSTAAFNLMFPCLLLVQTADVVSSGSSPTSLAAVASVAALQIASGGALGWGAANLFGLRDAGESRGTFRQAVVASAFGNATTLPLVLGSSLCVTLPQLSADPTSSSRYVGYLALYQLAWSLALWTVGFSYLKPEAPASPKDLLDRLASPPSLGSLAGVALGATGVVSSSTISASPLFPVYSAVSLLGQGAQPALAMVLSLSLLGSATDAAQEKDQMGNSGGLGKLVDLRLLGSTLLVRSLLMPLVGGALVELAYRQPGLMPEDPVAHLVLLLEAAMPTAQVLVLLAQVGRREVDDGGALAASVARLLLAQYVLMTVPIGLWLSPFITAAFSVEPVM